ncbi:MAG: helix-turn-helix domain-containing protein [Lachnospiraceae bacterium]
MEKNHYLISEAAGIVDVESHVLRYWEEELDLFVPRNEMGHRYYTGENIQQFQQIKELKEEGYQLKAIKMLLKNEGMEESETVSLSCREKNEVHIASALTESKLEQFQNLMNIMVKNAITESNREAGQEVSDRILKEMNYMLRVQDEQEEERFKKLDTAIRQHQKGKKKREGKKVYGKGSFLKPKLTTP